MAISLRRSEIELYRRERGRTVRSRYACACPLPAPPYSAPNNVTPTGWRLGDSRASFVGDLRLGCTLSFGFWCGRRESNPHGVSPSGF